MQFTIKMTSTSYRQTEYYLQKRYKSKTKLPALAKLAMYTEAAAQAKKELEVK